MKRKVHLAGIVAGLFVSTIASGQENLINSLTARPLGPTTMGGRVADIAVYEKEPRIFFVATAGGGLWKTENGGLTMNCVWPSPGGSCFSLGAVDVSQKDPNLIWIGTGEQNGRNSVSWGDGVYKSTDGGKTWSFMGLKETHHIGQVVIDPKDNNVVYVAAVGRLWGRNPERGVYKTTDGGKTWTHVFKIDENTGVVDLQMDPSNNNILFAAAYDRIRFPWNLVSGGPKSGLFKSTDAGKTWRQITKGMPQGMIGRIGLDFHRKDPNKMVAIIEAGIMPSEASGRPQTTGGVFVSEDKGESWTKVNNRNSRPFYFSIVRSDPDNFDRIYVADVQIAVSDDRGKTLRNMRSTVHVDHHAFWINPNDPNHIIIGEDGGVGQTRDKGETWQHVNYMDIGQFYAIAFDMRKPYWVYGGLQDNGTWGAPTQTARGGIGPWDWFNINGGDGFYVQVDPDDWRTVYTESQGGAARRIDLLGGGGVSLRPRPAQGERYRFNWNTPILLSPHNSKIVYIAGNRVFRSMNRGANMEPISPDLTTDDPEKQSPGKGSVSPENTGAEVHCTVITISESPLKAGVIWAGTDDGNVQVTEDYGGKWTNVAPNIPDFPKFGYVSRVHASPHSAGRCYVTVDNHRMNDFKTYVYMTDDYGKTWTKLNGNLPAEEPAHLVRDGLRNPDLLFLGTDHGLWVSFDRGKNWARFKSNFPTTPVHDFAIQPREQDLVIGTHGRSIWTLNVSALEELTASNRDKDIHLAKPQTVYLLGRTTGGMGFDGDGAWTAPNSQPGTDVCYYLKADGKGDASVTITDAAGGSIATLTGPAKAGLNVVRFRVGNRRLAAGDLRVTVKVGDFEAVSSIHVEDLSEQMAGRELGSLVGSLWP